MWMPTHVQVTVQRATELLTKGKNGTNDCFVTIALGKTKYQTSVKEKALANVEWHEECELPIPDQGNTAEIILTVLHRNFLGVDEFLGRANIRLSDLDTYEKPRNRWYVLQSKPGKERKNKDRGHLEVKVAFTVRSGSLTDLSKKEKHKSSMGQISQMAQSIGGSLLSINSIEKRKGLKKFAKSLGSKVQGHKKKEKDSDENSSIGSIGSLKKRTNHFGLPFKSKQTADDADPGVVSDEDDFTFDDLSHKSSGSSLNQSAVAHNAAEIAGQDGKIGSGTTPLKPPKSEQKSQDEWDLKLSGKQRNLLKPGSNESLNRRSWESPTKLASRIEEEEVVESDQSQTPNEIVKPIKISSPKKEESMLSKLKKIRKERMDYAEMKEKNLTNSLDRVIIGGENNESKHVHSNNRISAELLQKFEGKSREELILLVCELQGDLNHYKKKMTDLEDYLDELLLRVMETTPRILQNPYVTCKMAHSQVL